MTKYEVVANRYRHLPMNKDGKVLRGARRFSKGDVVSAEEIGPEENIDRLLAAGAIREVSQADEGEVEDFNATPSFSATPEDPTAVGAAAGDPTGGQDDDDSVGADTPRTTTAPFDVDNAEYEAIKAFAAEHDLHAVDADGKESFKKKDLIPVIKKFQAEDAGQSTDA